MGTWLRKLWVNNRMASFLFCKQGRARFPLAECSNRPTGGQHTTDTGGSEASGSKRYTGMAVLCPHSSPRVGNWEGPRIPQPWSQPYDPVRSFVFINPPLSGRPASPSPDALPCPALPCPPPIPHPPTLKQPTLPETILRGLQDSDPKLPLPQKPTSSAVSLGASKSVSSHLLACFTGPLFTFQLRWLH